MDNTNIDEIKVWYYIDNGEVTGPFTEEEMLDLYHQRIMEDSTEVWKSGMSDWIELSQSDLIGKKETGQAGKKYEINNAMPRILALFKRASALNKKRGYTIVLCLLFAVVLLCSAIAFDIPAYFQTKKVAEVADAGAETAKGSISIEDFVQAYITSPNYELTETEEGYSILHIIGKMEYEAKETDISLDFQVDEDGSVHFKEIVINGKLGGAEIYYNMVNELKNKIE